MCLGALAVKGSVFGFIKSRFSYRVGSGVPKTALTVFVRFLSGFFSALSLAFRVLGSGPLNPKP